MREWAVVDRGRVVTDPDWHSPADVMAGAHGHDTRGPVDIAYRDTPHGDWVLLRTCIECDSAPVRATWLTEHDDGTVESTLTEALADRGLYCRQCYDGFDPAPAVTVRGRPC